MMRHTGLGLKKFGAESYPFKVNVRAFKWNIHFVKVDLYYLKYN